MRPLEFGFTQHLLPDWQKRERVGMSPFSVPETVPLDPDERCRRHALIVGSPSSGKSKFMEHLIRQDILNRQGLCVIDIHGTLYQSIKRFCAYKHFLTRREIILLDPSDAEYVKGFNPFRPKPGVAIDVQVAGMVQALLRVWGAENTDQTPTLDRVLRLLFTAMVEKRIPLHDAFYLINFDRQELREDLTRSLESPIVKAAWQQIHNLKRAGEWRGEVLSTENRLFRLVSSKTMQRFLGVVDQDFNLDTLKVMDEGKVLLVNLKESALLSEENAKAFAALLLNDFFKTAIMFRDEETRGYTPRPFYVYLDEWQNIVTPDIKKILAQARKFGVNLILANQDLSQIAEAFSPEFVNTLMTCCQIKACFGGLNRMDARRMVEEMLVGQIDLDETKYILESTKFWPVYTRDRVYTVGTQHSSTVGSSQHDASSVFAGQASGEFFQPDGWLGSPALAGTSSIATSGSGQMRGSGSSQAETYGDTTSVADVPILIPVPFKEVSNRVTYSLEEQLWRWSDRFMEQYQRHCYLKLPENEAIPLLVPFVRKYFVYDTTATDYEKKVAELIGAKAPHEVDAIIVAQSAREADASPQEAPSYSESGDIVQCDDEDDLY